MTDECRKNGDLRHLPAWRAPRQHVFLVDFYPRGDTIPFMKMVARHLAVCLLLGIAASAIGQEEYSTPAADAAQIEAMYTHAIEGRAAEVLETLSLTDEDKIKAVRDAVINQYRALRARDAVVEAYIRAVEPDDAEAVRAKLVGRLTEPLHELYVGTLSSLLTPDQVDAVKDYMTYNKVTVTYNAYVEIIPNLKEPDKTMILSVLKEAREDAMDAGSAPEKHQIFEVYKERINKQLKSNGYDVDKAFTDWEAKQSQA